MLAAFFIFSVSSSHSVRALEVDVSSGVISVYQSSVLGDTDPEIRTGEAVDSNRKRILTRQKQRVRVEKTGERTEIELRPTPTKATEDKKIVRDEPERIEQLETDRLQMEFEPDVHLRSSDARGDHRLELESHNVKAHIPEGLQFELDSGTNEVSLIAPTGEQRTLNHLPDQAVERMKAAGIFSDDDELETTEVSVNTDTQEIEYRQKVRVTKRLLGMFKRNVDTEVVLNDATGEVHEEAQSAGFAKFLDSLSV